MLAEVYKQLMTEFDYMREARALERVAATIMLGFGGEAWGIMLRLSLLNTDCAPQVVVPRPVLEMCTRDVVVMEFVEGKKLADGIREEARIGPIL